mgnify:CR=1 FL=1
MQTDEQIYQQFVDDVKNNNLLTRLNSEGLHRYAYCLWHLDKNEEALAAYRQALEVDNFPENTEEAVLYNNMGVLLLDDMCELQAAREAFIRAVSIRPEYGLAHFNLGRVLNLMNDYELSESAFEVARILDPDEITPEKVDYERGKRQ